MFDFANGLFNLGGGGHSWGAPRQPMPFEGGFGGWNKPQHPVGQLPMPFEGYGQNSGYVQQPGFGGQYGPMPFGGGMGGFNKGVPNQGFDPRQGIQPVPPRNALMGFGGMSQPQHNRGMGQIRPY